MSPAAAPVTPAGPPPPPPAADVGVPAPPPGALALARLYASRARLSQRLLPPPPSPAPQGWGRRAAAAFGAGPGGNQQAGQAHGTDAAPAATWSDRWDAWRARLSDTPLAPVIDTGRSLLDGWWQRQPWRVTAEAVGSELRATALPVVQRHPWAAVLLSAGLAAGLVWWRPWQSGWLRPHVQPLPRRAGRWLVRQASLLPLQAVVPALLAAWRLSQPAPTSAPAAPVASATPAGHSAHAPPGAAATRADLAPNQAPSRSVRTAAV